MRDMLKYLEMIFQKVLTNNAEELVSVNTENIKEYLAVEPDKTNLRVLYNNQYQYYSEEERREIEGMFSHYGKSGYRFKREDDYQKETGISHLYEPL